MPYKMSENFGIIFKVRKLFRIQIITELIFLFSSQEKKLALRLIFKNSKFESVEFDALKYLLSSFKTMYINIQSVPPKMNLYELHRKQLFFKSAISSHVPLFCNKILPVTIKSHCFYPYLRKK